MATGDPELFETFHELTGELKAVFDVLVRGLAVRD